MAQKKSSTTDAPKIFSRVDRRNAILTCAARRMLGDPSQTWNNFATLFTNAIYPDDVTEADLTEALVRSRLKAVLALALENLKQGKQTGKADDLLEIMRTMPRGNKRAVKE